MSLRKSIAIALLATNSLISVSVLYAEGELEKDLDKSELQSAAILLGTHTPPPSSNALQAPPTQAPLVTSKDATKSDQDISRSAAILLGVYTPPAPQVVSKVHAQPRHYVPQRHASLNPHQLRQKRLLNKRKLENQQRAVNKQRRLNHQQRLLRQQAHRSHNYGGTNRHVSQRLPGNSVWHRVRNGFRFRNENHRPEVKRAVSKFRGRRTGLMRTLNRSSDYLHFVATELERRRMPTDFVLLPMVESAYKNKAVSHAGAVGMWQFIPSTGLRYGLKQTRGYDGRMDVLESTRAAMDYLQKLNRQFNGDWFLSLAAYNCGEARVQREIDKNRARGLPTDYWNLNLPRETKNYVPKLLAYREVIRSPRSFGVQLPNVVNTAKLVQVHVNKAVDLKVVARNAGVHHSVVTNLNPGYKYGVTMPSMTRRIVLPREFAGNIQRAIQRSPAVSRDKLVHYAKATTHRYKRSKKSKKRIKRTVRYRVRSGENLSKIASRYGTTVKKIMRLNRMRSSRVKAGKHLKIAVGKKRSRLG